MGYFVCEKDMNLVGGLVVVLWTEYLYPTPQNSYDETLSPSLMVLGGGAFGR